VLHDITKLKQTMQMKENIFQSARSPMVVTSAEGTILKVNRYVAEVLGYTEVGSIRFVGAYMAEVNVDQTHEWPPCGLITDGHLRTMQEELVGGSFSALMPHGIAHQYSEYTTR